MSKIEVIDTDKFENAVQGVRTELDKHPGITPQERIAVLFGAAWIELNMSVFDLIQHFNGFIADLLSVERTVAREREQESANGDRKPEAS